MLFGGSKSRRIVVASHSRCLCKTAARINVLRSECLEVRKSWGQHEYGNRPRSHAGSMGNVEGASRPCVGVSHSESIRCRRPHRPSPRGDERQFAGYYTGRTQGPDKRLVQIVGRGGLTPSHSREAVTPRDVPAHIIRTIEMSRATPTRSARLPIIIASRFPRISGVKPSQPDRDQIPDVKATIKTTILHSPRPCGGPGIGTKCGVMVGPCPSPRRSNEPRQDID